MIFGFLFNLVSYAILIYFVMVFIYGIYLWAVYGKLCLWAGDFDRFFEGKKFKWVIYGVEEKYYNIDRGIMWWHTKSKRFIFKSEEQAIKKLKKEKKINTEVFVLDLTFNKEKEELKELFYHFPYHYNNLANKYSKNINNILKLRYN